MGALSRFSKALFAAALLHGAAALLARAHRPEAPAPARPAPPELVVELDEQPPPPIRQTPDGTAHADEPAASEPSIAEPSTAPQQVARASAPNAAPETARANAPEPVDAAAANDAPDEVPPAPLAEAAPPDAPGPRRKIDLGLDGTTFLLAPRAPAPPANEPEARAGRRPVDVQRRLNDSLAADDVQRGLARGGALIGSLQSAVRADGPTRGEAVFQVTVDSEGKLGAIHLVRGEVEDWGAVERAFRQHASKKRVRLPPGARGLRVTYAVQAKVQHPSGRTDAPAISLKRPSLEPNGLIPQAGFDLADLGGGAQRVVYARVVSEEVL